ncbi:MAG: hypothetical protein L0I48_05290 [Lactococcus plantarum]|nr:hypothetical protein [Lactococcus plantarum]
MKEKTTLYHVNNIEKIEYFFTENKLVVSNHRSDGKYAGKGMYFWDNRGNADYWFNQKLKHCKKSDLCLLIVSTEYDTESFLDLTDSSQEKEYMKILDSISKYDVFKGKNLGEKVDYLCEYLGCKIVRFITFYPRTQKSRLLEGSFVTNKNKVIYCVKPQCYDIIKSKQKEVFS